jgi:hypothetical protein
MRGKLVVLLVLLSGVVVGLAGLRYTFDPSPVYDRFDQRRDPLPADATGPRLLVEKAGDFDRVEFEPVAPDAQGIQHGRATYKELGENEVQLVVQQIDYQRGLDELSAVQKTFENDTNVSRLVPHADAQTPYLYAVYAADGRATYEFVWVNNGWLLRAYTNQSDAETLLRFANTYPN